MMSGCICTQLVEDLQGVTSLDCWNIHVMKQRAKCPQTALPPAQILYPRAGLPRVGTQARGGVLRGEWISQPFTMSKSMNFPGQVPLAGWELGLPSEPTSWHHQAVVGLRAAAPK